MKMGGDDAIVAGEQHIVLKIHRKYAMMPFRSKKMTVSLSQILKDSEYKLEQFAPAQIEALDFDKLNRCAVVSKEGNMSSNFIS